MLLTILVFLITLSLLVIFHELGHFLAAKKAGIKIEEFGLGYPPRLWGKKVGGTIYSLNLIPFGGFVRLFGQEMIDPKRKKGAFWAKSKRARLGVIWAGVLANVLLSFLLFSLIYLITGIPVKTDKVIFEAILEDSPAGQAGIEPGDVVISFAGEAVGSVDDFVAKVEDLRGKMSSLVIEREGVRQEFELTSREEVSEEEGPLGVLVSSYETVHFPFWQMPFRAAWEGAKETWGWLEMIVRFLLVMIRGLIATGRLSEDIAGPIGILQITSRVAHSGFVPVLQFIAILSINLVVINFFPFPGLDGGHSVFVLVEAIMGRRSPEIAQRWINGLGMVVLVFLMVAVTVNDFKRILNTTEIGSRIQAIWPF